MPVSAIGMVGGDDLTINEMVAVSLKAMHDAYYNSLPKMLAKA